MGCSGNAEIHTPNLDRLAGQGVRFDQTYCPNAMCSPCRASVLTGLMPSQHGVHTWLDDYQMDGWPKGWNAIDEFDSLPRMLDRAGYDTALIGKYHLGFADTPQNGFGHWVTLGHGHVLTFYDNEMNDNGHRSVVPGHCVDYFTDKAVDYIAQHDTDDTAPFFLYLTYPAPYGHWPSVKGEPDNDFAELYRDMPMDSVPREGVSQELIDWIIMRHDKMPGQEEGYYQSLPQLLNDLPTLRNYYSQMSIVDHGVGRVMDQIDASGLADDTIFIYTADHGMSLGQHGFWGHGEDTWPSNTHREAHNIPLIIRDAKVGDEGQVNSSLIGTTDVFSTIADYAGLMPSNPDLVSGRSLRPLLEGKDEPWQQEVYMEQEETRSIRTPDWLFMQRFTPTTYGFGDELYDLNNDLGERTNLIGQDEYEDTIKELRGKLDTFFGQYSNDRWDLWHGGTVKGNSTRPFLWEETWGNDWKPEF